MDEEAAGGCHGCLICGTINRPLRCENCVNQALGEKRRISDTACASGEAARGRLAAALEASPKAHLLEHGCLTGVFGFSEVLPLLQTARAACSTSPRYGQQLASWHRIHSHHGSPPHRLERL